MASLCWSKKPEISQAVTISNKAVFRHVSSILPRSSESGCTTSGVLSHWCWPLCTAPPPGSTRSVCGWRRWTGRWRIESRPRSASGPRGRPSLSVGPSSGRSGRLCPAPRSKPLSSDHGHTTGVSIPQGWIRWWCTRWSRWRHSTTRRGSNGHSSQSYGGQRA